MPFGQTFVFHERQSAWMSDSCGRKPAFTSCFRNTSTTSDAPGSHPSIGWFSRHTERITLPTFFCRSLRNHVQSPTTAGARAARSPTTTPATCEFSKTSCLEVLGVRGE